MCGPLQAVSMLSLDRLSHHKVTGVLLVFAIGPISISFVLRQLMFIRTSSDCWTLDKLTTADLCATCIWLGDDPGQRGVINKPVCHAGSSQTVDNVINNMHFSIINHYAKISST